MSKRVYRAQVVKEFISTSDDPYYAASLVMAVEASSRKEAKELILERYRENPGDWIKSRDSGRFDDDKKFVRFEESALYILTMVGPNYEHKTLRWVAQCEYDIRDRWNMKYGESSWRLDSVEEVEEIDSHRVILEKIVDST